MKSKAQGSTDPREKVINRTGFGHQKGKAETKQGFHPVSHGRVVQTGGLRQTQARISRLTKRGIKMLQFFSTKRFMIVFL